jgi:hypothetical protein
MKNQHKLPKDRYQPGWGRKASPVGGGVDGANCCIVFCQLPGEALISGKLAILKTHLKDIGLDNALPNIAIRVICQQQGILNTISEMLKTTNHISQKKRTLF